MRNPRLVLILLAVSALAARPALGQERVEGDLYANAKYGIQIGKPSSWYFITAGTVVDLARKAGGGPRLRGDEDPVKLAGFAVVVSKVPSLGRGFQPQVVVLVRELSAPPGGMVKACEELRSGMTEPETVRPTRVVQVDGRPAARLDFQGLVDGEMVRATALCAFRDRQAFVVVGQALASEFDSEFSTFEMILSSFRLR
ncbi:MAG: hypothetical protein HY002_02105 [Candidatus Rokubacteria bacterium]|nr:hypothetical protein [Candidatus Rokubacteria bacterium]